MQAFGSDWELLGRYAREGDAAAFAELVRRHVDLVFSAAQRRVGSRQMAEDVTQAVFIVLAQKARKLCNSDGPMSAWLLGCVRYVAANAMKMEARRRKHERLAWENRDGAGAGACSANPTDVLVWQEIAQQLDDAVLKLPAVDRQAILLRYFEDRPVADIAAELRVSEGAAKMRLTRALEKLRGRLSKRGGAIVMSMESAALASLIASHAVRAAPAGLMTSSVAAATGAAGAAGTGALLAKGAMTMMAWTKTKIAAAVIGVAMIGTTGGVVAVKSAMAAEKPAPAPAAKADAGAKSDAGGLDKKANNGIISVATAPPVVVSSEPAAGATDVDASAVTELKVTFSKEMETGNFSWVRYGKDTFPTTTGKPKFLDDKKTCVLPVKLEPGHPYVIWLNKPPYDSFMDTDGHKAVAYLLVFETKK